MKALFIFPSTALGGAELTLQKIALELKKRGWDIYLVFLSGQYDKSLDSFDENEIFLTK